MLRRLTLVLTWPFRVYAHRRVLAQLGAMDDRALADIGLHRQDLRDVTALPLGVDPSGALAQRAREREDAVRSQRRRRPCARMAAE